MPSLVHFNLMDLKPNIPILQERQIWQRNKEYKHWGSYKVFKFVNGEPTYLIASVSAFALLIALLLAFVAILLQEVATLGLTGLNIITIIRACMLPPLAFCYCLFYKTNPGIASHSLPIINELELTRFKNFCAKCRYMQSQTTKHCQECDVCIEHSYVHSNILKTCISPRNVYIFCCLWGGLLLQSLLFALS